MSFLIIPSLYLQQSLKEGLTVQERMKLFEAKDSKKIWLWWNWNFLPPPWLWCLARLLWPCLCRLKTFVKWGKIYMYIYIHVKVNVQSVPAAFMLLGFYWSWKKRFIVSALFKIFFINTHTHNHRYIITCPCLTCQISWEWYDSVFLMILQNAKTDRNTLYE